MSDQIRCPMCGKPNPADAEICRYCHARLKPLRPGEAPQPKSTAELESTLPPWMQTLRENTAADALPETGELPLDLAAGGEPAEEPLPAEEEDTAEDDLLWAPDEEEDDLPDWLKSLGGEESEESKESETVENAPPAPVEEALPAATPLTPEDEAESTPPLAADETALPDWLAGDQTPAEETSADQATSLPDWLAPEAEAEAESAPPLAADETALPDWLAGDQTPAEETSADQATSLPDWLAPEAEAEAESAPPLAADETALPDWLAGDQTPAEETSADQATSLPDWLAPEAEAEAESTPPLAADETALPDWLAGDQTPAEETSADQATSLPDWLAPEAEAEAESAPPGQASLQPFLADVDLPEDLLQETPDWLALLSPDEDATEEAPEKIAGAEEAGPSDALTAGELPSWLEAMRPVAAASVGGAEEDEAVETEGPLAGLRGVIAPPEPTLVKPGRVATIGGKLFLTDQQEAQAKTLQALLAEEFAPREPEKPPTVSRQRALRWFIGVVLLAVAFLPLILPPLQAPPPNRILPAARAALQAVDAVPQGAPVLVGVDYSPAFAAEMETTAAPLLRDLLAKGARLTVVSTQPTGPALATRFFQQGLSAQEGRQYLNLGYLPGGTAGLFAFAQNPRLVFTHAAGHTRLWETPFLQTVHRMSDFAMVVVITEDADTARAWIEQVRPALGDHTPLIALISAQAEPMIEPYYETASHQVAGVVTGMAGSLAYSAARGQQPDAPLRGQWSSYSYVILFAALMVAAAGLYNLALGWKEAHARRAVVAEAELAEADSEEEEA